MRFKLVTLLVLAALLTGAAFAQCRLTTTFVGGNNQRGCMFDVVALQAAVVTGFEVNLPSGTHAIQIWTKTGTWIGAQNTPSAWTSLGSASAITSAGPGLPTPVPIPTSVLVAPGAIRSFYVSSTTSANLIYSNGTAVGATVAQDLFLQVLEGCGIDYPFAGAAFQPRGWNGRVLYHPAGFPEWQVNQVGASLTVDGVVGSPCERASLDRTICSAGGLNSTVFTTEVSGTLVGMPHDIIFTAVPAIPMSAGGIVTTGIQLVNLDLSDPFLTPLFGTGNVGFANTTMPMNVNFPIDTTMQMAVADPLAPDGASISQVNEVHVKLATSPAETGGPAYDDAFRTFTFAHLPCAPPSFPFYGINYTTFSVVTNGRVMFGTPTVDYQPSINSARTQSPSINAWVDLNPYTPTGGGGSIAVNVPGPHLISIDWLAVPYYAAPASSNTFSITLDAATGSITIAGVSAFQAVTGSSLNMFLGLSAGGPLATNAGPTPFAPGFPFTGAGGNAMTYQFGPIGTLAAAVSGIVFLPAPLGGYAWSAY